MNPQENIPTPSIPGAPLKIGKFKASRMIVRESWDVLRQDKELAWFPIFSMISSLFAMIIMFTLFFLFPMGGDINALDNAKEDGMNVYSYIFVFIYYVVMYLIANYFLAGVYTIVNGRFKGQNLSMSDGFKGANKNLSKIFIWSLISATVGMILKIISDKFKGIGKIVASLFGAAWAILTYFSLPSLIIGQKSVKESFKESASLIRKTWGETIIVNFGVGLFFMLLIFLALVFCVGMVVIVPTGATVIIMIILFVIFVIAVSIISSVLGSIFRLALYQFALTGNVPKGFTPELIQGAVKPGK